MIDTDKSNGITFEYDKQGNLLAFKDGKPAGRIEAMRPEPEKARPKHKKKHK